MKTPERTVEEKPLKGDAWLVREIDGKMKYGIFFRKEYAENFRDELDGVYIGTRREVVKIRLETDTNYYN